MKKHLRIAAIWAVLLLCLSTVPVLPVAALEIGDEVPLVNAGFEDSTEDAIPAWASIGGQEEFHDVSIETKGAYEGEKCVRIHNTQGSRNPWVTQQVAVPVPGSMYEVSVWVNMEPHAAGSRAGIKIEQYKENGDYLSAFATDSDTISVSTNNQWVELKYIFQASAEAAKAKIYLRLYGNGVAKFDDVKLTLSGGPEPYSFFADHVFHYPDEKEGNAYIYLDSYYGADSKEATEVSGRFTLLDLDGTTALDTKENVKFAGGVMKYTYPVSLMTVKEEKYLLKTELLDKTGAVIREWSENFYVYDRPLWMPDKKWRENGTGEVFVPVIAYHVDIPTYAEVAAGGFNVVQTSIAAPGNPEILENTLQGLEENNIKGLFTLYYERASAAHPTREKNTRAIVEKLKDDPRVWAWAVIDEPLGGGVTAEMKQQLEDSYRLIRSIDKNHPVFLVDFANHRETAKYVDVLMHDTYCLGDSALYVSERGEALSEEVTRIPIYELAASYKKNDRFPPMKTARGSVYRGMEVGAGLGYAGTGFYAISNAIGHDAWDEGDKALFTLDVWPDYCTLLNVEVPILAEYYLGDGITDFNAVKEGERFKELLWRTWFNEKGEMYLLAHNRSTESKDFNIPLASKNGKIRVGSYKAEPIGLTATGEKSGEGSISFTLTGEEAALYKITPAEKVDLTNIDAPSFDDLAGYEWAQAAIVETQANGIINSKGESTYAPGENITRGDFAGYLIRTLGFTSDSAENFTDVPAEREYAKEISAGRALGILNGIGDNLFSPEEPITRQDMMTICARGMKMAEKLAAADPAVLDAFADKDSIADYALESVSAMVASGIIQGDGTGLNPLGNTTRAEAAVIMQRILHAEKVEAAVPSEPTVENEVIEFAAPSEEQMARYTRSIDLLKGLGTPAITPEKSITNGEAEAVLSAILGYAYDGFGENHLALTTQSAVEALVKLLGYEVYTGRDGGYMGTASFIELTKGINTAETHLRGGEFALLLENALGIYLADPTSYGDSADGRYVESEDTLLTRFRHLTLYKGVLNQNENTGLARGKVAVGTNLLDAGNFDAKNFIGQKVEAYTEGEDNTIVYIRANKNVSVTTVDAEKINRSETDMSRFVYEDENGKTKSITISGADVLFNGKYKTDATVNTISPVQGMVTLIENGGSSAEYVLVEAYENYVVDSIWAEDHQIFFKNREELIWDETDSTKRLSMEGAAYDALKEWNVVSLYESEDGSVMRAAVNAKTAAGTVTEMSDEDITVDGTAYKRAENIFGTIELGEEYTFLLDAAGKIAGINDESVTKNYAYFTSAAKDKGIGGKVRIRVFTSDNTMRILPIQDTFMLDGTSVPAEKILESTKLFTGTTAVEQLIALETVGEGENEVVTSVDTAEDFRGRMDAANEAARLSAFSLDFDTTKNSTHFYQGHGADILASKFFVDPGVLHFVVPDKPSDDVDDYNCFGYATINHDSRFYDCEIYDIDENNSIAVIVEKRADVVATIRNGLTGVIVQKGKALTDKGETVTTIQVVGEEEATLILPKEDFEAIFSSAMTTEATSSAISADKLEVGDVILYSTDAKKTVTGLSVLYRANHAPAAKDSFGGNEGWWYGSPVFGCGNIYRVLHRGFTIEINSYLRAINWSSDLGDTPIVLVEDGKVKRVTPEHLRDNDRVFFYRSNPYTLLIAIFR